MKITTVAIKEGDWERLWDEVDKKYDVITTIGSDYTQSEMGESARELFKANTSFARLVKSKDDSGIDFYIFSKRNLSSTIFKALAELYNSDYDDDNNVVVKTSVLKTLLGKKRYAKLIK